MSDQGDGRADAIVAVGVGVLLLGLLGFRGGLGSGKKAGKKVGKKVGKRRPKKRDKATLVLVVSGDRVTAEGAWLEGASVTWENACLVLAPKVEETSMPVLVDATLGQHEAVEGLVHCLEEVGLTNVSAFVG